MTKQVCSACNWCIGDRVIDEDGCTGVVGIRWADRFRHKGILTKMLEQEIKNFSEQEQDRVFRDCVGPATCKRGLSMMIRDGLTIEELYGKRPPLERGALMVK